MRTRSLLRALVATAALVTTVAPATAAEPTGTDLCVDGAGCVSVFADPAGAVHAAARPACAPENVVALCTPDAGLGSIVSGPGPVGPRWTTYPLTAGCTWAGTPGSRVDFGGTAVAAPHAGASVTDVSITCALFVDGAFFASAHGVRWGDTSQAHKAAFPPKGSHVSVCLTAYAATWSDGHREGLANNQCTRTIG